MKSKARKSVAQTLPLVEILEQRFTDHQHRHPDIPWKKVLAALQKKPQALATIQKMESSGGEPDVIGVDEATGQFLYCDCSAESPEGRRSLCYDKEALDSRKENKPAGSALQMAAEMGVELLTEHQYRILQELGEFDLKTSSWIVTPDSIRSLGGALFCDRRYGQVFVYHNGAQSYYAARGFRGLRKV